MRKRPEMKEQPKQPEETPEQEQLRTKQPYEYERQKLRKELLTNSELEEEFEAFKQLFYPVMAKLLLDWPTTMARLGNDLANCMWQMEYDKLPFEKYKKRWELFCLQYMEDIMKNENLQIVTRMDMTEDQKMLLLRSFEIFSKLKKEKKN
jgi:hypothetical protein